jgi:hypothetical protein
MTLSERDDYVCRQSAAVMRVSGYDMPELVALDYLADSEQEPGYRFDVLSCVFNCVAYSYEHKRDDTPVKEAFENMLTEAGVDHVHRLTDELFKIAEAAARDELEPLLC